ncbi:MAG: Asp-tRNA(Asn)/Glu-tRNA(Gln) amidotransferase subunit GatC [Candidatus Saccharibacteria bacterium]|nr:Asp-tRNA(Asn)/Glu-tRNA(Gln) amidotransferase subunit GatC [Candidatus Saccharibacteria bacterium]
MKIDEETTEHLTELSKFALKEEELKKSLMRDLDTILDYISILEELDAEDTEPTYQVSGLENVWREDEVKKQDASPDELLELAEETEGEQVKIPRIL